jgi:hypothetical protein
MPRSFLITHEGKSIFFMDFSNLKTEQEIRDLVTESARYIRSQPRDSVLTLTHIKDMHFSNNIKDMFKDFISGNKPFVKAGAVVGLNGLQQIIYNGLMKLTGRNIKSCQSLDDAKDWLAAAVPQLS